VGFEPTIPAFQQAKTFHALDLAATVIGCCVFTLTLITDFRFYPEDRDGRLP
jgi:hypothetical protein